MKSVNYVLQAQLYIIPLSYEPKEDHTAKTDTLLFTPQVIHEICVFCG